MVYGRVADVTTMEELSALQLPATPTACRGLIEETEDYVVEDDIVDVVPARLLPSNKAEDGPEIFKHVRFVTRWEDFEESIGSLVWSSGGVSCWWCAGPAWDPAMQLAETILNVVLSSLRGAMWVTVGVCFIGPSRQESKPVAFIYTHSEKWHRAAVRAARKWLRSNNPRLLLTSGGDFQWSATISLIDAAFEELMDLRGILTQLAQDLQAAPQTSSSTIRTETTLKPQITNHKFPFQKCRSHEPCTPCIRRSRRTQTSLISRSTPSGTPQGRCECPQF